MQNINQLTTNQSPWSNVVLEKLIEAQLVKEFPGV